MVTWSRARTVSSHSRTQRRLLIIKLMDFVVSPPPQQKPRSQRQLKRHSKVDEDGGEGRRKNPAVSLEGNKNFFKAPPLAASGRLQVWPDTSQSCPYIHQSVFVTYGWMHGRTGGRTDGRGGKLPSEKRSCVFLHRRPAAASNRRTIRFSWTPSKREGSSPPPPNLFQHHPAHPSPPTPLSRRPQ